MLLLLRLVVKRSPHGEISHLFPQRERRPRTESGPPAAAGGSAVTFVDRYLEKHISPHALTSRVKINPLFPAQRPEDAEDGVEVQPSWTVEDYRAQTRANLAEYLKVKGHADSRLNKSKPEMSPARSEPSAVSAGGRENA